MPGSQASVATRFLNVSLHRWRGVLDLGAISYVPTQLQADTIVMFGWLWKAVGTGRLLSYG